MARPTRTPTTEIGPGVLRAAIHILDSEGPDGFTVRAIAKEAGIAPMAIYNHFDGMNGVLEALWTEGFELLDDAVSFASDDALADLMNAGAGYRGFALANRGLYTVMFMHRFRTFSPSEAARGESLRPFESLVGIVERCQRIGLFAQATASDVAQAIWSSCHGYVSLELLGINFSADPEATYESLLATLREGFR